MGWGLGAAGCGSLLGVENVSGTRGGRAQRQPHKPLPTCLVANEALTWWSLRHTLHIGGLGGKTGVGMEKTGMLGRLPVGGSPK